MMGIGTSLGAFYDDEFHYQQSQHDPKRFDTNDENVVTPNQQGTNKALDDAELNPSTGMGLEVGYKTSSPLVNITDEDINTAINVGMAAGPGTMAGVKSQTSKMGGDWFKGSDGKMRYEISDEGMKLVDRDWKFGDKGKVSDFIDHPELFKAYPQLKDINFEVAPKDYEYIASYNHGSKTLMVNPRAVKAGDEGLLDVVSHELQHSVQSIEGFSPGSNPNVALGKALIATTKIKDKDEAKSIFNALTNQANAFANYFYQRTPGEVEANLTAARRKLTAEERKKWSPDMTQELLNGSDNTMSGGTYHPEFNYPKYDHAAHSEWRDSK